MRDIKLFHLVLCKIARRRDSEQSDGNAHLAAKREEKFNLCEERNALLRSSFVLKFKNARVRGIIYTKDHRKAGRLSPTRLYPVARDKRRQERNKMFVWSEGDAVRL